MIPKRKMERDEKEIIQRSLCCGFFSHLCISGSGFSMLRVQDQASLTIDKCSGFRNPVRNDETSFVGTTMAICQSFRESNQYSSRYGMLITPVDRTIMLEEANDWIKHQETFPMFRRIHASPHLLCQLRNQILNQNPNTPPFVSDIHEGTIQFLESQYDHHIHPIWNGILRERIMAFDILGDGGRIMSINIDAGRIYAKTFQRVCRFGHEIADRADWHPIRETDVPLVASLGLTKEDIKYSMLTIPHGKESDVLKCLEKKKSQKQCRGCQSQQFDHQVHRLLQCQHEVCCSCLMNQPSFPEVKCPYCSGDLMHGDLQAFGSIWLKEFLKRHLNINKNIHLSKMFFRPLLSPQQIKEKLRQ